MHVADNFSETLYFIVTEVTCFFFLHQGPIHRLRLGRAAEYACQVYIKLRSYENVNVDECK